MKVTPNFNFDGQCQEAIDLYQRAFQAEVACLLHYSDAYALTQFGIQCLEGIRCTNENVDSCKIEGVTYAELSKGTMQKMQTEILGLYHQLVLHL